MRLLCRLWCRHRSGRVALLDLRWTSTAAETSAFTQFKLLFCKNKKNKEHFSFWNLSLLPAEPQSYCHSVCEGQTYPQLLSQPLPFFFFSTANQGQCVLLSVFTERLMTHVQATIFLFFPSSWGPQWCAPSIKRTKVIGDNSAPGFGRRKTTLKQTNEKDKSTSPKYSTFCMSCDLNHMPKICCIRFGDVCWFWCSGLDSKTDSMSQPVIWLCLPLVL